MTLRALLQQRLGNTRLNALPAPTQDETFHWTGGMLLFPKGMISLPINTLLLIPISGGNMHSI